MKEILDHPSFKRFVAVAAIITAVAFVDDFIMIASFVADGSYWAAAGRALAFILVGGAVALLWRRGGRYLETVGEAAQKQVDESDHVSGVCERHPPFGRVEQLGGVCMVCRFENLDEATKRKRDHDRELRERVEATTEAAQRSLERDQELVRRLEAVEHRLNGIESRRLPRVVRPPEEGS